MEDCVKGINDEVKNEGETTHSESTIIDAGKGVNNEKSGKGVDLYELDESTCSDDTYYDIYDNQEEIITEDSIFWVNTNKTIWYGRVIKIPFSDVPEDARHLKLIWINKKSKKGF